MVLPISAVRLRDGGHSKSIDIRLAARAIALEISLQGLVALRDDKLVVDPREMVHADVAIAVGGEPLDGELQ